MKTVNNIGSLINPYKQLALALIAKHNIKQTTYEWCDIADFNSDFTNIKIYHGYYGIEIDFRFKGYFNYTLILRHNDSLDIFPVGAGVINAPNALLFTFMRTLYKTL